MKQSMELWRHTLGGFTGAACGIVLAGSLGHPWLIAPLALLGGALGMFPDAFVRGAFAGAILGVAQCYWVVYSWWQRFHEAWDSIICVSIAVGRTVRTTATSLKTRVVSQGHAVIHVSTVLIRRLVAHIKGYKLPAQQRGPYTRANIVRTLVPVLIVYSVVTLIICLVLADWIGPETILQGPKGYYGLEGPAQQIDATYQNMYFGFLAYIIMVQMPLWLLIGEELWPITHKRTFRLIQSANHLGLGMLAQQSVIRIVRYTLAVWMVTPPVLLIVVPLMLAIGIAWVLTQAVTKGAQEVLKAVITYDAWVSLAVITVVTTASGLWYWPEIITDLTFRWLVALCTGAIATVVSYSVARMLNSTSTRFQQTDTFELVNRWFAPVNSDRLNDWVWAIARKATVRIAG